MKQVKSCGIICFTKTYPHSFLLLRQCDRYDLPKGHVEKGETEVQCALRELFEETGITSDRVILDADFRFKISYDPGYRGFGGKKVVKSVIIFLGWVDRILPVTVTEHVDFAWFQWSPPHYFKSDTIDSLLLEISRQQMIKHK